MSNVYTPIKGFAQKEYFDQMGPGLAGQLLFASDQRLIDSFKVKTDNTLGVEAGLMVLVTHTSGEDIRPGMNAYSISPLAAEPAATDRLAITIRNQQMETNSNGKVCWFDGRMANAMRPDRVGGRMLVQLASGDVEPEDKVYVLFADTTSHGKPLGSFTNVASADAYLVPGARFIGTTSWDVSQEGTGIAIVEFGLRA